MLDRSGTVILGDRRAQLNHRVLIPRLAQLFPEIAGCRSYGTINLQWDDPLRKDCADLWTGQITWRPVTLPRIPRVEAFGFTRVKLDGPLHDKAHEAWIMMPEASLLSYNDQLAEVIAGELVRGVDYGTRCTIHLEHRPVVARATWFGETYGLGRVRADSRAARLS